MGAAYHITPADREYDQRRELAWVAFQADVAMNVRPVDAFNFYRQELVEAWEEWSEHFEQRG